MIDWNNQQDSEFVQIIKQQNVQNFIQFLNDSQPSKLDVEIKLYPTSETDLLNFFTLIQLALETKQNYELLQSILQVFLRCNGDVLKTFDHEILTRVKNTCNDMAMRLESKLLYGLCLLDLCLSN